MINRNRAKFGLLEIDATFSMSEWKSQNGMQPERILVAHAPGRL